MLIRFTKYKTPTMRYRTKSIITKSTTLPYRNILPKLITRTSARNNNGHITVRGKQSNLGHSIIKPNYFELLGVNSVFRDYFVNKQTGKSYISVLTSKFSFSFIPCVKHITPGDISYKDPLSLKHYSHLELGLPIFLKYIPFFFKICNLVLFGTTQPKYSTSPGTFIIKLRAEKKEKLIKLKLPSKIIKFCPPASLAIIGINEDNNKKKFMPGKAGINRILGSRPITRGVAQNPVDHPNGGRTKSCQPEKSPWGWIAKSKK